MGLFCILCKGKANSSVSLFRFPSDHRRRTQWADVCKIDLSAILPSSRVCSRHFHCGSFVKTQTIGKKIILNDCAVPSEIILMNFYEEPENYKKKYQKSRDNETKLANSHGKNRDCFICGTVDSTISRFRFPSNILQRIEWAKFCNIKERDIKNWYRLCRKHFNPVDMDATLRPKLRAGVVPSIYSVSNKIIQNTATLNAAGDFFHYKDEETAFLGTERKINFITKHKNSNVESDFSKKKIAATALLELNKDADMNKESENLNLETALLESSEEVDTNKESENFNVPEMMLVTPTIRKRKFPRYIGDVTTTDIRTPKRARLLLHMSRSAIAKYRKKVHQLQITNNYLRRRVHDLQNTLLSLQQKKLLE